MKDTFLSNQTDIRFIDKVKECFEKCLKTKALNRAFKTSVPLSVYEELNNGN